MIIAHVAGLTQSQKETFKELIFKLDTNYTIVDLDDYTDEIMLDSNMAELVQRYEYNMEKSKGTSVTKVQVKSHLAKARELNTKINSYWKTRMEFYLNELVNNCPMSTILIGYINFYRNIRIALNLDVETRVFIDIDMEKYTRETIATNLEIYKDDIIAGFFNLEMISGPFLIKRRNLVASIYDKKGYALQNIEDCVGHFGNKVEKGDTPVVLYYASTEIFKNKITIKPITAYVDDWIAIASAIGGKDVTKGYIDDDYTKPFIQELTPHVIEKFHTTIYLYAITNTVLFTPIYTNNYIYKYKTTQTTQIFKSIKVNDAHTKLKELNISFFEFK
jgi:hypothetical protein